MSPAEKLVRDKIPDIIRSRGGTPDVRTASEAEYRGLLRDKLREEAAEAAAAGDGDVAGELADVLEVVAALAADLGISAGELEQERVRKAAERGGFAGRVVWRMPAAEGDSSVTTISDRREHEMSDYPRKIYLAARYSRNAEMRGVRDVLQALGHEVTSRWIDQHGGNLLESSVAEKLNAEPGECSKYAEIDIADLKAADTVISFTSAGGGGKGGRHIEFGFALGLGKRLVICGPRENVFHTLPAIEWYPDWAHLVMAWSRPVLEAIDAAHRCVHPVQPPEGSILDPGPCRICGKTWARAQAESALREAQAAMAATETADA